MELSPQAVSAATFKTVKKGYDPDEVRSYLAQVAGVLESTHQQATAMEARARAAIAKLQDLANAAPAAQPTLSVGPAEAETISRTLLLAQRTADTTVAEAKAEAEALTKQAEENADRALESAQAMAATVLDEARIEARRTMDDEVQKAENEVQALLARRDFLLADVDQLEHHVVAQRDRLREASVALLDLVERVPGGLGDLRRPLLSASGETSAHVETDEAGEPEPAETEPFASESVESGPGPIEAADVPDQLELDDTLDPTPISNAHLDGLRIAGDELR